MVIENLLLVFEIIGELAFCVDILSVFVFLEVYESYEWLIGSIDLLVMVVGFDVVFVMVIDVNGCENSIF